MARLDLTSAPPGLSSSLTPGVCVDAELCSDFADNQDGSDWRDDDEKLPGHENLTEKDIELFRHIQDLALEVGAHANSRLGGTCTATLGALGLISLLLFFFYSILFICYVRESSAVRTRQQQQQRSSAALVGKS